jgi:hypothetical protein
MKLLPVIIIIIIIIISSSSSSSSSSVSIIGCLCCLMVIVHGCRLKKSRLRFPALPDILCTSVSGTVSNQSVKLTEELRERKDIGSDLEN